MRKPTLQSVRTAYTLIELIIVLMIIGILAAAAAPTYFEAISRFRAKAAARRIASDLNHVRSRAKTKAPLQEEWVRFYLSTEEYQMINGPDPDRPGTEYWVDLQQTGYPAELVSVSFQNSNGYNSNAIIKFDMYGRAHSGSPPLFPNAPLVSGTIVVESGGVQRSVVIDPVTGKASVL